MEPSQQFENLNGSVILPYQIMIPLFSCCLLENYEIEEKFSLFLYAETSGRSIKEKKNIKLMIFLLEKSETAWDLRMGAKEIDSGISQIALLNATIMAFSRLVYEMK
jgi:hypothetical protein